MTRKAKEKQCQSNGLPSVSPPDPLAHWLVLFCSKMIIFAVKQINPAAFVEKRIKAQIF